MQVVAAVRGVCSGAFERRVAEFEETIYDNELLNELKGKLTAGKEKVLGAIAFVKERGTDYMDLSGRRLVDSATAVLIGHLLLARRPATNASSAWPADTSSWRWASCA